MTTLTREEKDELRVQAQEIIDIVLNTYEVDPMVATSAVQHLRARSAVAEELLKQRQPKPYVHDADLNRDVAALQARGLSEDYDYATRHNAKLEVIKDAACLMGGESLRSFKKGISNLLRLDATIGGDSSPLSLGWKGTGMVGGFIFCESDRTWGMHS